jgi:hypothetical protein
MTTLVKGMVAIVGLITLAYIFPMVKKIFDWVADNGTGVGTGILYTAGGAATNNSIIMFLPILGPIIFFVAIIIYVVVSGRGEQQQ